MPRTLQEIGPRDALLWLPFRDQYTDASGNRVTRNFGLAPGAPATCQMGDGVTAATFPTQIGGGKRGVVHTGSSYVVCNIPSPGTRSKPLTAVNCFSLSTTLAATTVFWSISNAGGGADGGWWSVSAAGTNYVQFSDGNKIEQSYVTNMKRQSTQIITYDGSITSAGIKVYDNGKLAITTPAGGAAPTTDVAWPLVIGATAVGALPVPSGMINRSFLWFPFALTPTQVAALHARLMREANLP